MKILYKNFNLLLNFSFNINVIVINNNFYTKPKLFDFDDYQKNKELINLEIKNENIKRAKYQKIKKNKQKKQAIKKKKIEDKEKSFIFKLKKKQKQVMQILKNFWDNPIVKAIKPVIFLMILCFLKIVSIIYIKKKILKNREFVHFLKLYIDKQEEKQYKLIKINDIKKKFLIKIKDIVSVELLNSIKDTNNFNLNSENPHKDFVYRKYKNILFLINLFKEEQLKTIDISLNEINFLNKISYNFIQENCNKLFDNYNFPNNNCIKDLMYYLIIKNLLLIKLNNKYYDSLKSFLKNKKEIINDNKYFLPIVNIEKINNNLKVEKINKIIDKINKNNQNHNDNNDNNDIINDDLNTYYKNMVYHINLYVKQTIETFFQDNSQDESLKKFFNNNNINSNDLIQQKLNCISQVFTAEILKNLTT
jgi:hypothetical protein